VRAPAGARIARRGYATVMARGDHPKRTVFYGTCLCAAAFLSCWLAASVHQVWLSAVIYVLAALMGIVGSVMTLRDYG
jgi:MFS family permease